MPIEEVTGAVEDGLDVSLSEVAALYDGVYGFKDIVLAEFERTGDEESRR